MTAGRGTGWVRRHALAVAAGPLLLGSVLLDLAVGYLVSAEVAKAPVEFRFRVPGSTDAGEAARRTAAPVPVGGTPAAATESRPAPKPDRTEPDPSLHPFALHLAGRFG
jgi:hypothetical protein